MPLLKIETNTAVSDAQNAALLERGAQIIVDLLKKPLDYVQIMVEGNRSIAFAGNTDPAAFVELRSLGLPGDTPTALSGAICALLQEELGISPKRVFINFFDIERSKWGWDNGVFG